ncbi:MAG: hypothetical protein IJJ68_04745 [Prevotella sp.]|nr:hypothetical protein [Prevotella sp.]
MKKYIIPVTEIMEVELQEMIAQSLPNNGSYGDGSGYVIGARPTNFDLFASPEVEEETPNTQKNQEEEWDDFEEEEI